MTPPPASGQPPAGSPPPPPPPVADRARDEDERQWRTVLAFLLAPGIAALSGGLFVAVLPIASGSVGNVGEILVSVILGTMLFGFYFGLVGYFTAGLVSAPLYAILPARLRDRPVAAVPLAGCSAAAPWLAFSPFTGAGALIGAVVAFPLGCVAGVAFVLIRDGLAFRGARRGWRR